MEVRSVYKASLLTAGGSIIRFKFEIFIAFFISNHSESHSSSVARMQRRQFGLRAREKRSK